MFTAPNQPKSLNLSSHSVNLNCLLAGNFQFYGLLHCTTTVVQIRSVIAILTGFTRL